MHPKMNEIKNERYIFGLIMSEFIRQEKHWNFIK